MHVLEAVLVANLVRSPRSSILGDCRIEAAIGWPLDRRQFEELTEMAREARLPPFADRRASLLDRFRAWLASAEPAAERSVA